MGLRVITKKPEKVNDQDLLFNHNLMHHAYKKISRGKTWGEWDRKKVVSFHQDLVAEIRSRHLSHHVTDNLDNTLTLSSSAFFEVLREFRVRVPFVSVLGGFSNWSDSYDDMDFMLGTTLDGNIIATRTIDILASKVGEHTIHLQDSKYLVPFSNHIPLYNLKLKFNENLQPERDSDKSSESSLSSTLSGFMSSLADDDVVLFDDFISFMPIGDTKHIEYIDVYFSVELTRDMALPIEFRLIRQFGQEYWKKFRFHYKEPPDDAIPYYGLVLERTNKGGKVFELGIPPMSLQQANHSKNANKIEPGKFFYPLKTSLSPLHAYRKDDLFSVESAVKYLQRIAKRQELESSVPPVFVEKKYDGLRCTVTKNDDIIKIYTDSGLDKTWRFPSLIRELRSSGLPQKCILDAICEGWVEDRHIDREAVSGYVNASSEADDSHLVFNVFDILLFQGSIQESLITEIEEFISSGMAGWKEKYNLGEYAPPTGPEQKFSIKDLHDHPYQIRRRLLQQLPFKQSVTDIPDPKKSHLNLVVATRCASSDITRKALKNSVDALSSEGAMIKAYDSIYSLTGSTTEWAKLKKEIELKVVVWRKHKTGKGTFNYDIALEILDTDVINKRRIVKVGKEDFLHIGRTYNTEKDVEVGNIIKIRFHELNLYEDTKSAEKYLSVGGASLHEVRGKDDTPDSISAAVDLGRETGLLHEKFSRSIEVRVEEGSL